MIGRSHDGTIPRKNLSKDRISFSSSFETLLIKINFGILSYKAGWCFNFGKLSVEVGFF